MSSLHGLFVCFPIHARFSEAGLAGIWRSFTWAVLFRSCAFLGEFNNLSRNCRSSNVSVVGKILISVWKLLVEELFLPVLAVPINWPWMYKFSVRLVPLWRKICLLWISCAVSQYVFWWSLSMNWLKIYVFFMLWWSRFLPGIGIGLVEAKIHEVRSLWRLTFQPGMDNLVSYFTDAFWPYKTMIKK